VNKNWKKEYTIEKEKEKRLEYAKRLLCERTKNYRDNRDGKRNGVN
jgi:hypothetical protein